MCVLGTRRHMGTDHIIRYDENRKHRIFPKETFILRDVYVRCPCAYEANVGAWELIILYVMMKTVNIEFFPKKHLFSEMYMPGAHVPVRQT